MRLFASRKESESDKKKWTIYRWFDIVIHGELYLSRLTLLRTPWFSVKLHWIHKPDPDRDLHDHPWPFCSFVLRGWYKELECLRPSARGSWITCDDKEGADMFYPVKERLIRWFNSKNTRAAHRITEVSPRLLTLVFTGPKTKSWGFYDSNFEFTDWKEYIKTQHGEAPKM
jgi:hypothetical protein